VADARLQYRVGQWSDPSWAGAAATAAAASR
jgi:hypothetical protein